MPNPAELNPTGNESLSRLLLSCQSLSQTPSVLPGTLWVLQDIRPCLAKRLSVLQQEVSGPGADSGFSPVCVKEGFLEKVG